jgi:hypothetical protein
MDPVGQSKSPVPSLVVEIHDVATKSNSLSNASSEDRQGTDAILHPEPISLPSSIGGACLEIPRDPKLFYKSPFTAIEESLGNEIAQYTELDGSNPVAIPISARVWSHWKSIKDFLGWLGGFGQR